ncbi:hypothetical protein A2442_02580 [Candidatus Campbellbacteria bacterium RIFOXYC2_FULL_35_25]|uniref:Uncharacterized protein n=1 Tax=Candidatus Campbellbacteria bacterium RIFOXYC2_FULL_35_25 TaxID=1797582 RepID=A0A1F5EIG8_9BACT|nr:MAG: hypothetical protein A2442_02580 [Candidatus Campbellbacteria bacterium RIFOXYC2_FULL_35_25]
MEKINSLKKIIPISTFIMFLAYLMDTYLFLPNIIPFSRELDLVNCRGFGWGNLCFYNTKGWVVLSLIVFIFVSIVVYFLNSRKRKDFKQNIA